jgi:hypothetical protein
MVCRNHRATLAQRIEAQIHPPDPIQWLPCCICGKNKVWIGGGYDTCQQCIENV